MVVSVFKFYLEVRDLAVVLYTVYLDQVFFGNFIMNYIILWAAARIIRTPAGKGRLVAGSAMGAVYSLALFTPVNIFMSVWCKIIASLMITAVTFAPLQPKKFLACLGSFYLCSFALGGLIFGMIYFIQPAQIAGLNSSGWADSENFWPGLVLGIVSFGAACKSIAVLMHKRIFENSFKTVILIKLQGVQVQVDAIFDTGNQLIDPMTKQAVIVVEYRVLKPLLPAELQVYYEGPEEPDVWRILSTMGESQWRSRFGVVPFSSLGCAEGLMVGFRPDEVVINRHEHQIRVSRVVIAIHQKRIDPADSYHALMHPQLLNIS
ncbi:MAG: sigma-E processing peptidase SpoIIGA [Desulfotomaculaceae bacterium]|nr:sigma-E processing peptidase SpoIIGA [Desulfotomaculaceae bacterium]